MISSEKIIRTLAFFKKHVSLETLDDVYSQEEKEAIMADYAKLEAEHNNRLQFDSQRRASSVGSE